MKQIFWLYAILGFLSLNAFELEVDMGLGSYYTGSSGELIYTKDTWKDSSGQIDHASAATFYGWMEFTSDQKYWPKLRIELSHADSEGKSLVHISANPIIDALIIKLNEIYPVNDVYYDSKLSQTNYEAYLYYEYFEDSDYPSLGLGAGIKKFDFAYSATIIPGLEFTDNGGEMIPLIFFKSRYELDKEEDGVQMAFEGNVKYYIFGDSNIYDYQLKMEFMMVYNEDTDLGVEFGYRNTLFDIKGSDIDTVGGDMSTSGVFVGFVGHFR